MKKSFYSNGKLLITGEYAVLDGAKSFALPTKFGQSLDVTNNESDLVEWKSYDHKQNLWFQVSFSINNTLAILDTNDTLKAETLRAILLKAKHMNHAFLKQGVVAITKLNFPRNWGLGTSSTLINNIANWAKVDAFELLWNSFGGSGYDIACAQHNTSITYQIKNKKPFATKINFKPAFTERIFFVYLNQKQDSKEGIKHYKAITTAKTALIEDINTITNKIIGSTAISDFEQLLETHENTIAETLQLETVKSKYFKDYTNGVIKSLGAWGGDFVLVTGETEHVISYFNSKGYQTIIPYKDMIL